MGRNKDNPEKFFVPNWLTIFLPAATKFAAVYQNFAMMMPGGKSADTASYLYLGWVRTVRSASRIYQKVDKTLQGIERTLRV